MLFFLIVGLALGFTRWRFLVLLSASVALFLWLLVCFTPVSRVLVSSLGTESSKGILTPGIADAAIVLGSGIQMDNEFTDAAQSRFVSGLEVVRSGFAPLLVLPEARPPAGSYVDTARDLTARLKIPCSLVAVGPVNDTHDEAVAMASLARQWGWRTVIVITSPTHSRRAARVFRQVGRDLSWKVLSYPCHETSYDLENLPYPSDRLKAFSSALHELIGLWMYRRRGWIE